MTDKSYPPPCRNYLQPLYLSVTLYACAQRVYAHQRNTTIYQIPYQINTLILLSGCPLYDDAVNVEIFKIVQRFIIESGRFD